MNYGSLIYGCKVSQKRAVITSVNMAVYQLLVAIFSVCTLLVAVKGKTIFKSSLAVEYNCTP